MGLARIVDPATMSHSKEDGSSDDEGKETESSIDPPTGFGSKPVRGAKAMEYIGVLFRQRFSCSQLLCVFVLATRFDETTDKARRDTMVSSTRAHSHSALHVGC